MKSCTFFGHRQCPATIKPRLKKTLVDLIEQHGVTTFYMGNQGAFDTMARSVLCELSQQYPHITYTVVLAYLPTKHKPEPFTSLNCSTIYPDGIEFVPKRFAIDWRNRWMLKQADYVVTYITHSWGGAAKYAKKAKHSSKQIINIGSSLP